MSLKERISSPLEAGPSILDGHHLPPHLTPALEYASSRLAKKALHLTLVVVRRDYHLPMVIPPQGSPNVFTPTIPASPPSSSSSFSSTSSLSRFSFAARPVTTLKRLVRNGSRHSSDAQRYPTSSNTHSSGAGHESPGSILQWPRSPATPLSPPPMTPCTSSSLATDYLGPMTPGVSGLRFLHAPDLSARDQKAQRAVFAKTAQRFKMGSSILVPALSPTAYGMDSQLFTNSVLQNEVLFSSDSLTILSLDRMYSLKAALSNYSKTRFPLRLEDAVDELRRYILASNGTKVNKSDLYRSYDWLKISSSSVSDLDRMYRRAYGGPDAVGAISGIQHTAPPPKQAQSTASSPKSKSASLNQTNASDKKPVSPSQIGLALTTFDSPKPPSPRGPTLKIQTTFVSKPLVLRSKWDYDEDTNDGEGFNQDEMDENENDGDRTARPVDSLPVGFVPWTSSIDQVLSAGVASPDGSSMRFGPMTPKGYEDISPITRGEWGFLMVDDAFKGGRTVAVETC